MVSNIVPELGTVDLNNYNQLKNSLQKFRHKDSDYSPISTARFEEIVNVIITNCSIDESLSEYACTLEKSYRASKEIIKEVAIRIFTNYFESLSKRGVDLNKTSWASLTPLHWSVSSKCPFILQALINLNADISIKCYSSLQSLLHSLASLQWDEQGKECFDILIKRGSDLNISGPWTVSPNLVTVYNPTPLWNSVVSNNTCAPLVIRAMVNAKADINQQQRINEETLLHRISKNPLPSFNMDILNTLIELGADLFTHYQGLTAYKTARKSEQYFKEQSEKLQCVFKEERAVSSLIASILENEMRKYKIIVTDSINTCLPNVLMNIVFEYLGYDEIDDKKKLKRKIDELS